MIRRIVLWLPITVVLLTVYLAEAQQTKVHADRHAGQWHSFQS